MNKESFKQRIKRESTGFHLLDPEFVAKEKDTPIGYLIKVVKSLGRPLSEEGLEALGNIL